MPSGVPAHPERECGTTGSKAMCLASTELIEHHMVNNTKRMQKSGKCYYIHLLNLHGATDGVLKQRCITVYLAVRVLHAAVVTTYYKKITAEFVFTGLDLVLFITCARRLKSQQHY
jgi:hypothetical protein